MTGSIYETIEVSKNETGKALGLALDRLDLRHCSEKDLVANWLAALRGNSTFYEEGWYSPPPHGIIALFGKPEDGYDRICQPSFRPQPMWPRQDLYDEQDIIVLYASPIHRSLNLIGDFGLNLYRGSDAAIKEHFETVLQTTVEIARKTTVGMAFNELYSIAMDLGVSRGFSNNIESSTDSTGTNIGHTIPLSYSSDPTYAVLTNAQSFDDVKQALTNGRKFLNSKETKRIEENIAFTIEPRFSTQTMPNTWFHLTVIFENGQRRICHGFKPLFERFEMKSLLKLLPV